jgi:hypothetical protein
MYSEQFREKFNSLWMPEPNSGCHLWLRCVDRDGYGQICYGGKQLKAHRVSWAMHHGRVPIGMCVCHKCDTPGCINVDHLFIGTTADNMADKADKGRIKGDKHGRAKLSTADVGVIRRMRRELGLTQSSIADMFSVSRATVSHILNRRNWAHI